MSHDSTCVREAYVITVQVVPIAGGFAKAGTVYTGSLGAASLAHAQSAKAVSQYDVGCYQISHR